jgi:hypothetical protein
METQMLKHIPFYASLLKAELFPGNDEIIVSNQGHVLVYGAVEAHSMGDKGCIASNKTIGNETGLSAGRVANLLSELNKAGWVHVNLNGNNQRENIIPLLTLHADVNPPSRVSEPPLHADVNIDNNLEYSKKTIMSKTKVSDAEKFEVEKLYKGWLIEFVIGINKWRATRAGEDRHFLLVAAKKKVRLTDKRSRKLLLRQRELGTDRCVRAIKNVANAGDFYRGDNDSKWKATIDWLFNSTEKTEEWANK